MDITIKQKKDFARNLYMTQGGISQKEIAMRTNVTEATICRWVKSQGWDRERKSLLTTRDEQLSLMYNQLERMNQAINNREEGQKFPSSKEADAQLKLTQAIKRLETDTGITQKVEVCKLFLVWLRGVDSNKAMEYMPLCDGFIKDSMR